MNKIITIKTLVELLSRQSETDIATSDAFIKAFIAQIRDCLVAGEQAKIKGIGDFFVDKATKKICFTPDPEFADLVNAPFAMFSPEELDVTLTEEELNAVTGPELPPAPAVEEPEPESPPTPAVEEPEPEPELPPAPAEEGAKPEEAPPIIVVKDPSVTIIPMKDTPKPSRPVEPIQKPKPAEPARDYDNDYEEEEEAPSLPLFWIGWSLAVGLIAGLLIGFLLHDPIIRIIEPSVDDTISVMEIYDEALEPEPLPADTAAVENQLPAAQEAAPETNSEPAAQAPQQPKAETAQQVKYDVVESSLTALALKHYGHKEYWVYIHQENNLGNPKSIKKGQKVKIPPLSKYATASTDAQNLQNARNEAARIERKYK